MTGCVLHRWLVFITECFSAGVDESHLNETESRAGGGVLGTRRVNLNAASWVAERLLILAKWY